jgi:hypothetical protein
LTYFVYRILLDLYHPIIDLVHLIHFTSSDVISPEKAESCVVCNADVKCPPAGFGFIVELATDLDVSLAVFV